MGDFNPKDRVDKMAKAIKNEAKEKADQIKNNAAQLASIEFNKLVNAETEKIQSEYGIKREQFEIDQRIERSGKLNESRLRKMKERAQLIENLQEEVKKQLVKKSTNGGTYRKLMKDLIIQSLIKLMETNVELMVLKKDLKLAQELVDECSKEFTEIVQRECKKTLEVKITVQDYFFIDDNKDKGIIGGVILSCLDGKIVCNNTLNARIDLAFQDMLPEIRHGLF